MAKFHKVSKSIHSSCYIIWGSFRTDKQRREAKKNQAQIFKNILERDEMDIRYEKHTADEDVETMFSIC